VTGCMAKDRSRRLTTTGPQCDRTKTQQGFKMLRIGPQSIKERRGCWLVPHQFRRRVSLGTGKPSAASDRKMIWRIDAPVSSDL
jgi:hypothetical protein